MLKNAIAALFVLSLIGLVEAELIQHLDATVAGSVTGNPVTKWADQSGYNNHALKKTGNVYYPSTSLSASGLAGLNFGTTATNLELFTSAESDSWLDQRSGNGFCVLAAFKVDTVNPAANDVLGNSSSFYSGFGLRYDSSGGMVVNLGGTMMSVNSKKIANGDTVVYGFNYNPTLGSFEFWNSITYGSQIGEIPAADFSSSSAVTVGYCGNANKYLNGMVGEVKVFNRALNAESFRAEREGMAEKWANITALSDIQWRIIPEDPDYPTDDVIMAAISVDDASLTHPLPADPANQDCTATFQEAIDSVSQANGGTVWVPEGEYRFDNNLILRTGVSLRGRWDRPSATGWNTGSVLKIYHGQGDPDGTAFIITEGGAWGTIKELTFWHPNQSPANIMPYPYVIAGAGSVTYENITFVNAYRGLNQDGAGFGLVRGLYGTMLETGLMSDHGAAVPRFESLYTGPQYWQWWPLDEAVANPGQPGNYAYEMLNSGTFFRIQNMDVFSFYNADISGYSVGFVMENSDGSSLDDGNVPNHGQVSGVNIHDCKIAMHVKVGNFSSGLKSTFSGSQYGIYSSTDGAIRLTESTVSGGTYAVYNTTGSEFELNAKKCQINGAVRFEGGTLQLKACNFTNPGTHVSVTSGVNDGSVVWGCTYNGTQSVNITGAQYLDVDPTPMNYKPLPAYGINPLTDWNTVRKPSKLDLFNVVDYGAKGDGVANDTAAVIAAINAANLNGGGIVFFPFGEFGRYRITDNLNLGTGVELRGIGTRGAPSDWKAQSIILIEKSGPADGTPFITMGDGCGVRGGLVFFYPGNNWDRILNQHLDFIPYPYTIYAHGTNNYIIACTTPNPYQFADFNGATDPLVDMMLTGGLRNVYRVRGGTTGCRIMTGHIKPSGMWGNLPDMVNNKANYTAFGIETAKVLEVFDLDDCEDLTILAMFCRESQKLLTCDGAQGNIIGTAGEGVQNGFCFERAGAKPLHLLDTKPNLSEHGDETGKSGILVEPTFNASLDVIGGAEQGAADYKFKVLSGNIYAQERYNVDSGWAQLRGIYVGGTSRLTLYDNVLSHVFSLKVEPDAILRLDHSALPEGMPYAPVEGSLVIEKCQINENCILSVPGQTQFSQHGLILDQSNTVRVQKSWSWSEQLTTGNSFNLNVTESAFANSKVKNVDITIGIYLDPSSTNTVNVYYDSSTGEKLGKTSTFTADGRVRIVSFSVSDARFGSAASDIRIEVSNPTAAGLSYIFVRGNPAIEPPFDLTATATVSAVDLDWKGKSHWQFDSYNVYRSQTAGGPYTRIATGITATDYRDTSVMDGSKYYYVVKTVDTAANQSANSNEDSALPPDLTGDDRVDLEDLAEVASQWQTMYDMNDLLTIAENWLLN